MTLMPQTDSQDTVITNLGTTNNIRGLLSEQFSMLADAPQSVPRMRELILQLAVRGKLVRQDPGDEPAAGLLKKIAAEKARLVKEGKIRKQKPVGPLTRKKCRMTCLGGGSGPGWEPSQTASNMATRHQRIMRIAGFSLFGLPTSKMVGCNGRPFLVARLKMVPPNPTN